MTAPTERTLDTLPEELLVKIIDFSDDSSVAFVSRDMNRLWLGTNRVRRLHDKTHGDDELSFADIEALHKRYFTDPTPEELELYFELWTPDWEKLLEENQKIIQEFRIEQPSRTGDLVAISTRIPASALVALLVHDSKRAPEVRGSFLRDSPDKGFWKFFQQEGDLQRILDCFRLYGKYEDYQIPLAFLCFWFVLYERGLGLGNYFLLCLSKFLSCCPPTEITEVFMHLMQNLARSLIRIDIQIYELDPLASYEAIANFDCSLIGEGWFRVFNDNRIIFYAPDPLPIIVQALAVGQSDPCTCAYCITEQQSSFPEGSPKLSDLCDLFPDARILDDGFHMRTEPKWSCPGFLYRMLIRDYAPKVGEDLYSLRGTLHRVRERMPLREYLVKYREAAGGVSRVFTAGVEIVHLITDQDIRNQLLIEIQESNSRFLLTEFPDCCQYGAVRHFLETGKFSKNLNPILSLYPTVLFHDNWLSIIQNFLIFLQEGSEPVPRLTAYTFSLIVAFLGDFKALQFLCPPSLNKEERDRLVIAAKRGKSVACREFVHGLL